MQDQINEQRFEHNVRLLSQVIHLNDNPLSESGPNLPIPNHHMIHGAKARLGSALTKVDRFPINQKSKQFYSQNPQYKRLNKDAAVANQVGV